MGIRALRDARYERVVRVVMRAVMRGVRRYRRTIGASRGTRALPIRSGAVRGCKGARAREARGATGHARVLREDARYGGDAVQKLREGCDSESRQRAYTLVVVRATGRERCLVRVTVGGSARTYRCASNAGEEVGVCRGGGRDSIVEREPTTHGTFVIYIDAPLASASRSMSYTYSRRLALRLARKSLTQIAQCSSSARAPPITLPRRIAMGIAVYLKEA